MLVGLSDAEGTTGTPVWQVVSEALTWGAGSGLILGLWIGAAGAGGRGSSAWNRYLITVVVNWLRRRAPLRFGAFLDWSRDVGLLRVQESPTSSGTASCKSGSSRENNNHPSPPTPAPVPLARCPPRPPSVTYTDEGIFHQMKAFTGPAAEAICLTEDADWETIAKKLGGRPTPGRSVIRASTKRCSSSQRRPRPRKSSACAALPAFTTSSSRRTTSSRRGEIVLSVGFYPHAQARHGHGEGVGHDSAEKTALDELQDGRSTSPTMSSSCPT